MPLSYSFQRLRAKMGCKDGFDADKVLGTLRRCLILDKYRQHFGVENSVSAATSLVLHYWTHFSTIAMCNVSNSKPLAI
jgi:hypothetical protein